MNKIELSQTYQDNNVLLYETWYQKHMAAKLGLKEDVEFKGLLPSIDEIKKIFLEWFENNKVKLYQLICVQFEYVTKKEKYQNVSELIVALSEFLAPDYSDSFEITHMIVTMGLDKFCQQ